MQTGVDRIVFAMKAAPDGGARYADDIKKGGQKVPEVIGGVLEDRSVALMRKFLKSHPNSPAIPYVEAMLKSYSA